MPELPEVETIRAYLDGVLRGKAIEKVILHRKNLRFYFPQNFCETLEGATVHRVSRRGKFVLIVCRKKTDQKGEGGKEEDRKKEGRGEQKILWLVHLGMSGRLLWLSSAARDDIVKHRHVCVRIVGGGCLCYEDARRFGFMELAEGCEEAHDSLRLGRMGIEPLSDAFTGRWLWESVVKGVKGEGRTIKDVLMDQRYVAGLGNIYTNEALWHARVHPFRRVGLVTRGEYGRIVASARKILRGAIAAGGSSLRDYRGGDGKLGYFQLRLKVYGRKGEDCKRRGCGGKVMRMMYGGRACYWCERVR